MRDGRRRYAVDEEGDAGDAEVVFGEGVDDKGAAGDRSVGADDDRRDAVSDLDSGNGFKDSESRLDRRRAWCTGCETTGGIGAHDRGRIARPDGAGFGVGDIDNTVVTQSGLQSRPC